MNRTSMSTYSLSSYIKNILMITDCSSFKTIHELGLDPCERGRIISSIIKNLLFYMTYVRKDQVIIVLYIIYITIKYIY